MAARDTDRPMASQNTFSNNDAEEWSKGQATTLITASLLSGITLVLIISYWLTRELDYGISLEPLYWWEIILFTVAMSVLILFTCLRNNEKYVVENRKSFSDAFMDSTFGVDDPSAERATERNRQYWTYVPLRNIVMTICCFGGIIQPLLETSRNISKCFEQKLEFFHARRGSNICCALFSICQLCFLLYFKTKSAKTRILRFLMSTVAAANFTLCANVLINILQARDTIVFKKKPEETYNFTRKPIFAKCIDDSIKIDHKAEWIHKFTYQFPVEYVVLSLCYFGAIWNVFKTASYTKNQQLEFNRMQQVTSKSSADTPGKPSEIDEQQQDHLDAKDTYRLVGQTRSDRRQRLTAGSAKRRIRWLLTVGVRGVIYFASSWAFLLSFIFISAIVAYPWYKEINKLASISKKEILSYTTDSSHVANDVQTVTETVYIYIICIVAPIGFMLARRENTTTKPLNASDRLLLVAATGHLIFLVVETVDFTKAIADKTPNSVIVMFYIKLILKYQGVFAEAMIVLIASKMEVRRESITRGRQLVIKGIIVFLCVFNTEHWFSDNFFSPNVIKYVEYIKYNEMYGPTNWWFLTKFLYPFVMIFRMTMAIMCFETSVRLNRLSSIE